ncbi:MAG: GntR family transcriptional regulator [Clostridia bacterium]|nr:GntR family transcriptional regulator [Clostridia bacterium]
MSDWKFDSSKPIFRQICDRIKSDVASGKYGKGEKFPSVRDLAVEIGVNPNTVQRALAELEAEGILETKRGDGRYLSGEAGLATRLTDDIANDACRRFVASMRSMGLSDEDIIAVLQRELTKQ